MKTLFGNELLNEFTNLLSSAKNRIWICSPYVGSLKFIDNISNGKITDSTIEKKFITDIHELSKLNFGFFNHIIKTSELRTLVGVHAKIYIVDNKCLVSSANLTETAFSRRHEIGLLLDENESKESIETFLVFWNKSIQVKQIEIPKIKSKDNESNRDEDYGFKLPKIWSISPKNQVPQFWLKPIGVTEKPITDKERFSELERELHFSENPRGVKINDILIAYGIGAKRILSIYRVKSLGEKFKEEDITEDWMKRWSYYLYAENLSPNFGEVWMKRNLYASDLVKEYLENNPDGYITATKNRGLGALQHKKDKIRLDPNFAGFILNNIEQK